MTDKIKLDSLEAKIKRAVSSMRSDKFAEKLTKYVMDPVQKRSFRYKTGKSFRKLSKGAIANRKYIAKYNKTHPDYSPTKPNLTITGRFLRSFKFRIGKKGNAVLFKLDARGKHVPYRRKDKKQVGFKKRLLLKDKTPMPVPNKTIRKGMAKIGRDPIEFSKKESQRIMNILKNELSYRLKLK
jgi:hypothetical protein